MLGIATAALNQTAMDWKGNTDRIYEALKQLAAAKNIPDIILFPELCISGYGCEDAFHSLDVTERSLKILNQIASDLGPEGSLSELSETMVILGLPFRNRGSIYNCAAVLYRGQVQGIVPKRNLAGDGVHYEPRWFRAFRSDVDITEGFLPFGRLLFLHHGYRVCIEICEDSWVPRRPALDFLPHGPDLILNPAASHFALGKQDIRRSIAIESSRQFQCVYCSINLLGCESGRIIYDGASFLTSGSSLLHEGQRFSFQDVITEIHDVDMERTIADRHRTFSFQNQDSTPIKFQEIVLSGKKKKADASRQSLSTTETVTGRNQRLEASSTGNHNTKQSAGENEQQKLFSEFLGAVSLGLFDYLRKAKAKGFVVSLSGGVDSAACAVLIEQSFRRAHLELGTMKFLNKIGRIDILDRLHKSDLEKVNQDYKDSTESLKNTPETDAGQDRGIISNIIKHLFITIYQASENSSELTKKAASNLASALNSQHFEVSVQQAIDQYVDLAGSLIGRPLNWDEDDIALQNIQARARAPMAWMLTNIYGFLLVTTSNRSESATGYCTMDGDTAGGIAPIAGIDKTFLRKWLLYMERKGDIFGMIPALKAINDQEPTAELRPLSCAQTDEEDLMPYDLLQRFERMAVRDRKSPVEIFRLLERENLYDREYLKSSISKYFKLWAGSQWKRERYAPSFHVDDQNLDPKSWYRFPILNGGYESELADLAALE